MNRKCSPQNKLTINTYFFYFADQILPLLKFMILVIDACVSSLQFIPYLQITLGNHYYLAINMAREVSFPRLFLWIMILCRIRLTRTEQEMCVWSDVAVIVTSSVLYYEQSLNFRKHEYSTSLLRIVNQNIRKNIPKMLISKGIVGVEQLRKLKVILLRN